MEVPAKMFKLVLQSLNSLYSDVHIESEPFDVGSGRQCQVGSLYSVTRLGKMPQEQMQTDSAFQAQISEERIKPYISGSHFRISFPDQYPPEKGEIALIEDRSTNGEMKGCLS